LISVQFDKVFVISIYLILSLLDSIKPVQSC